MKDTTATRKRILGKKAKIKKHYKKSFFVYSIVKIYLQS